MVRFIRYVGAHITCVGIRELALSYAAIFMYDYIISYMYTYVNAC